MMDENDSRLRVANDLIEEWFTVSNGHRQNVTRLQTVAWLKGGDFTEYAKSYAALVDFTGKAISSLRSIGLMTSVQYMKINRIDESMKAMTLGMEAILSRLTEEMNEDGESSGANEEGSGEEGGGEYDLVPPGTYDVRIEDDGTYRIIGGEHDGKVAGRYRQPESIVAETDDHVVEFVRRFAAHLPASFDGNRLFSYEFRHGDDGAYGIHAWYISDSGTRYPTFFRERELRHLEQTAHARATHGKGAADDSERAAFYNTARSPSGRNPT